jgi:hypothetical protein
MAYQSVKAVLRSTLPAESEHPARSPAVAQHATLEVLRTRIARASADAHITTWNKAPALVVPIALPRGHDDPYTYPDSVYVFFSGDEMRVGQEVGPGGAPLAGAPHLLRIIEAVQERLREGRGRARKRGKLRALKARYIETQVEALAARLGVPCDVNPMPSRVEVFAHFGGYNGVRLHVPYGRAEEVLAKLPPIIEAARELYRRAERTGVTFWFDVQRYDRPEKPA